MAERKDGSAVSADGVACEEDEERVSHAGTAHSGATEREPFAEEGKDSSKRKKWSRGQGGQREGASGRTLGRHTHTHTDTRCACIGLLFLARPLLVLLHG